MSDSILKDKTILFVEDHPEAIVYFVETMREAGATVRVRRRISSALDLLEKKIRVDFVCIDLFLDETDERLDRFVREVQQTGTNQGQLLGLYLQERDIPYLYLTASRSWFVKNDKEKHIQAFTKDSGKYDQIIQYMEKKFSAAGEETA